MDPDWVLYLPGATRVSWKRPGSAKQSRNFIRWSKNGEGRAHALKTASPWRREARNLLRGKRWVHDQNLWKEVESSRNSLSLCSPLRMALIVSGKVPVSSLGGDPRMVMKQRELLDALSLIYTVLPLWSGWNWFRTVDCCHFGHFWLRLVLQFFLCGLLP